MVNNRFTELIYDILNIPYPEDIRKLELKKLILEQSIDDKLSIDSEVDHLYKILYER